MLNSVIFRWITPVTTWLILQAAHRQRQGALFAEALCRQMSVLHSNSAGPSVPHCQNHRNQTCHLLFLKVRVQDRTLVWPIEYRAAPKTSKMALEPERRIRHADRRAKLAPWPM